MLHPSDPLYSLGFRETPEAFSFSLATLDPEAAIAQAQAAAVREYGRELGVVLYLGVEGDTTEVAATLRSYSPNDRRPFKASAYNTPGDGLDPIGITAQVQAMADARKGMA